MSYGFCLCLISCYWQAAMLWLMGFGHSKDRSQKWWSIRCRDISWFQCFMTLWRHFSCRFCLFVCLFVSLVCVFWNIGLGYNKDKSWKWWSVQVLVKRSRENRENKLVLMFYGFWTEAWQNLDRTWTEPGQNLDRTWTEPGQNLDRTLTEPGQNLDRTLTEPRYDETIVMCCLVLLFYRLWTDPRQNHKMMDHLGYAVTH